MFSSSFNTVQTNDVCIIVNLRAQGKVAITAGKAVGEVIKKILFILGVMQLL